MIVIKRREYTTVENLYIIEVVKGLAVTMGHLLTNMWEFLTRKDPKERRIQTWEYPEEPRKYVERARLLHRLVKRPDGTPKCVACYMCATICPANAIEIIAEPSPDSNIEKRPLSFVIDELRCVFCGFCVEACPKDAIRMDSNIGDLVGIKRENFVLTLEQLLEMKPRPGAYLGDKELEAKKQIGA